MPVIGIPVDMLLERVGTVLDRDDLVEHLQHLGCDVEGYATLRRFRCSRCDNILEITETENPPVLCDRCGADYKVDESLRVPLGESDVIRMELLAVRPDMFDPGGLARVLRTYLGEVTTPPYTLTKPTYSVEVDKRLADNRSFRPSIACAIVRGLSLDDDKIKVIMKLQENLHWALGRDRKHASIGVYDLATLKGTSFSYRSVGPEEITFTPLGYDPSDDDAALTPRAILEEHPKGKAYARLLRTFDRYPLLCDAEGNVLSMPPIINSEETRVRQATANFFIDVTGSEERIVNKTLNILVTSLAELDPAAKLEQVTIRYPESIYPEGERITPDLTPQLMSLDPQEPAETIGVALAEEDVIRHLTQMGHRVLPAGESGPEGLLRVAIPAYRNDIMHPIDLIEDIAIAYGYHNIEARLVPTMTVGTEQSIEVEANEIRRVMTGLGYFEVLTLLLSSPRQQFDALRLPHADDNVRINNPISVEQTMIRRSLVPGLLDTFSINTDHEMPQRIFEVGSVSHFDPAEETGAREVQRVAGGAIGPRVDYSELRSVTAALLRELSWTLETAPSDHPSYIPGRGADIIAVRGDERRVVGTLGELHPEVLEHFKLVQPASVFEVDLAKLRAPG
ncbi:MAG: phenylalanine--tRNA ligase subunit beta [Deltaproteobacteria bacterium]|nr:phenylalanine--tRNA ligase subunit beta [Deltaproteobacteria bacterium]